MARFLKFTELESQGCPPASVGAIGGGDGAGVGDFVGVEVGGGTGGGVADIKGVTVGGTTGARVGGFTSAIVGGSGPVGVLVGDIAGTAVGFAANSSFTLI